MIYQRRILYVLLAIISIPTFLKAEGQEGLVYIIDGFTFLFAFILWTILFFVILSLVKFLRKKENGLRQKFTVAAICLLMASFQFVMTKSDPYPFEGPIDEFMHRDKIRASEIEEALENSQGKPDSTIETTIAAIDTNKIGIYIWLNGEPVFVRKLSLDLGSQKRNDSLTKHIVRT